MIKAQIVGITIGRCDLAEEVGEPEGFQFVNFKPSPKWRAYPRRLIAPDDEAFLWFEPFSGKIELFVCKKEAENGKVIWRSTVAKLFANLNKSVEKPGHDRARRKP